jgi:hypothetical protein
MGLPAEFVRGTTHCSDCGTALVEGEPAFAEEEGWTVLGTLQPREAESLCQSCAAPVEPGARLCDRCAEEPRENSATEQPASTESPLQVEQLDFEGQELARQGESEGAATAAVRRFGPGRMWDPARPLTAERIVDAMLLAEILDLRRLRRPSPRPR